MVRRAWPGEHRGLEAELAHRVLELVDRELRIEHRDQRADGRAVAVRREQVRERAVRGAAAQADELVVGDSRYASVIDG
jgi:hypothetical protein